MANGQVAPAEQLWGPIRRDGCLRVLARTGRADCRRSCASFPPFSGSIAMSILKIEWMCIQERWNPEVVIILGTAACYRRATVGSSHDDAHPDNPTLHTGTVRPHPGFVESLLFISSRNGACAQVFEMLPAISCISWACIFAGDGAAIFFSGLIGLPFGVIKRRGST
jgi:hypothetical protein